MQAEHLAARFLEQKGYTIIRRNWRTPGGEIDLITKKDGILVFVEVKMRRTHTFGTAEDAFTPLKLRRVLRAMYKYLQENRPKRKNIRLDLITLDWRIPKKIQVRHYHNILEFL